MAHHRPAGAGALNRAHRCLVANLASISSSDLPLVSGSQNAATRKNTNVHAAQNTVSYTHLTLPTKA